MDKNTFGDFQSAIDLANILTKYDIKVQRKVGRALNKFKYVISVIDNMPSKGYKRWIEKLVYDDVKSHVKSLNFPGEVKSFTITVLTTYHRRFLENIK